ncbi:hypothetical protein P12B_c1185 [Escherichia coli P12b]|nr:hypothetical protein P12B_c1185 [Escherichia coli P12b]
MSCRISCIDHTSALMHCADEVFEKPLPHLFEAVGFLMGFALWGKLEFNQRDGFLDCPHGDRVCGGGMVTKVDILQLAGHFFANFNGRDYIENIQNLFDNQLASNHIRNQFLIGIQRLGHRKLLIAF